MWSEKTKLKKQLLRTVAEAGYQAPKEVQLKTLSRMMGGQDVIAIGPEGCGKTTAYVLATLNRFNYAPDGVPLVLILAPGQEQVEAIINRIDLLNTNKSITVVALHAGGNTETQMDELFDGADIVVATPDRARAIYLKLGLNLNKVQTLILDDADLLVKQGLQLPVIELANSIPKAQHLVFTEVMHAKLEKMLEPFMKEPAIIEIEEEGEAVLNLYPQLLYHVPNFGTKLNLLHLFVQDEELFTKTVVLVNTRHTAEKIYTDLKNGLKDAVVVLDPWFAANGVDGVDSFKSQANLRVLIVINNAETELDLSDIPFIIHFELPDDKDTYLARINNDTGADDEQTMAITFATDLELATVKKIEQASGQKIQLADLPDDLVIAKDKKPATSDAKVKKEEPSTGAAFHPKKASNVKNYNYSSGEKAKMNKKKKHG